LVFLISQLKKMASFIGMAIFFLFVGLPYPALIPIDGTDGMMRKPNKPNAPFFFGMT